MLRGILKAIIKDLTLNCIVFVSRFQRYFGFYDCPYKPAFQKRQDYKEIGISLFHPSLHRWKIPFGEVPKQKSSSFLIQDSSLIRLSWKL